MSVIGVYDIISSLMDAPEFTKSMKDIKKETGLTSSNLSNKLKEYDSLFQKIGEEDNDREKNVKLRIEDYIRNTVSSHGFKEADVTAIINNIVENQAKIAKTMRNQREEFVENSFRRLIFRRDPMICVMIKTPVSDLKAQEEFLTIVLSKLLSELMKEILSCERGSSMLNFYSEGSSFFIETMVKSIMKQFKSESSDPRQIIQEVLKLQTKAS
ncbi:MAG: hypothetical protein ACFFD4_36340 [Candidatus Odinarchaeota archaeon]